MEKETEQWQKYHDDWGLGVYKYEIGDIVTRDGNDEQEILEINYDYNLMAIKCIKEPIILEGFDIPWIKLGEKEFNLIHRYRLVRKHLNLDY